MPVSIFDGCGDQCGWIAAFVAALANGTYGVPIKETKQFDVHPLVMQVRYCVTLLCENHYIHDSIHLFWSLHSRHRCRFSLTRPSSCSQPVGWSYLWALKSDGRLGELYLGSCG